MPPPVAVCQTPADRLAVKVFEDVSSHLACLGYQVAREFLFGGVTGFVTHDGLADGDAPVVWISDTLTPVESAHTILVEAAHIMLGHTSGSLAEHRLALPQRDAAATRVARVAAHLLGLEPRDAHGATTERERAAGTELARAVAA